MSLFSRFVGKMRQIGGRTKGRVPHIATYTRELPISLERMYENALDWEHLPWLHSSSFASIECIDAGDWGWRAKAALQPTGDIVTLELLLDRDKNRWVTTTLKGPSKGTEIWTHAIPISDNSIKVIVDFFMPGLPSIFRSTAKKFYLELYAQLYDEDLWMMAERQKQLDFHKGAKRAKVDTKILGIKSEIEQKMPFVFEFNHREFRLVSFEGELIAHATTCPHMLGPLEETTVEPNGVVKCPWHGYQFDVLTGRCVSGQKCRLATPPKIVTEGDNVIAKQNLSVLT